MNIKILWVLLLFLLGLMALNNYFLVFDVAVVLEDKVIMLLLGLTVFVAAIIILVQSILLGFHKSF